MAVINDPNTAASIAAVGEAASMPLHTTIMPRGGNWYRYSGFTGTIGAALAASSELLQFRFVSGTKSFAIVDKVVFEGLGIVAVATAGGPLGFELVPARGWTVAGSGGTRIATTGDNLQTETALTNSQVSDIGISTTGALTVGTKTLDANAQGGTIMAIGTGAVTTYQVIPFGPSDLYNASDAGFQPLVLANQEGFVIRTTHTGPAALTYVARFKVVWAEVTAF
jgi:hypothetical protein